MKKHFSENRKIAWAVFALAILFSLSFSGGGALRNQRSEALDIFYQGAQGDGLCIDRDLKARAEAASNLIDLSEPYGLPADILQQATDARDQLDQAVEISELSQANTALQRSIESLYTHLTKAGMSESDSQFAFSQYKEFQSRGDTISRDPYNDFAARFNRELEAFPARFVGTISRVKPLDLF